MKQQTKINAPILLLVLVMAATATPVLGQCTGDDCVFVYRESLAQPKISADENTYAKDVELADLDGDGWLDIYLVVKQPTVAILPNKDQVYLSRGGPTNTLNFELDDNLGNDAFEYRPRNVVFGQAFNTIRGYDAEIGDVDGDGNLDVVRPDMGGILVVLWGTGQSGSVLNPIFNQLTDVLLENGGDPNADCTFAGIAGGTYDDVALADFDLDGDLDITVGQYSATETSCGTFPNQDGGHNLLIENRQKIRTGKVCSNGTHHDFTVMTPSVFAAHSTHSVSVGDANLDGNFDVLLAHKPGGSVSPEIYFGSGLTPFDFNSTPLAFTDVSDSILVTVADIVGVGNTFNDPCNVGSPFPEDQDDLTGDGQPDAFFAQHIINDPTYGLYPNEADPLLKPDDPAQPPTYDTFLPGPPLQLTGCGGCGIYDARYADLDDDQVMEAVMVTINTGSPLTSGLEFFGVTAGGVTRETDSFLEPLPVNANQGGIAVDLGDLDQDGDLDMVLGGFWVEPVSGEHFSAAHIYENRTTTRLIDRDIASGSFDFVALDELTAGAGTDITGDAQVTMQASRIVLSAPFSAAPASGTSGHVTITAQ